MDGGGHGGGDFGGHHGGGFGGHHHGGHHHHHGGGDNLPWRPWGDSNSGSQPGARGRRQGFADQPGWLVAAVLITTGLFVVVGVLVH
jgi:hypothetical protein